MNGFNNFEKRMFEMAKKEAELSDFDQFHVGAVITYNGNVIGRGHNSDKTHPMQKKYNKAYRVFNNQDGKPIKDSIHAEMAAVLNITYVQSLNIKNWNNVKIFIYRIAPGLPNGYGSARPCPACMHMLRDFNISNVYYTDKYGYSYLKIED